MQCEGNEPLLKVHDLEFAYSDVDTLEQIDFDVRPGEFVALMGPNGSGKTTTMRCINQILKKKRGTIEIEDVDLSALTSGEVAKVVTTVPADTSLDFVLTVRDFISLGRSPFVTNLWWESSEDEEIINRAIHCLGLEKYAGRKLSELSSGERARVLLAKGIVQTPKVMLVDEPSAHLDIKYKIQIMEILAQLSKTGIGIVIASHDINLLTRFCDNIMLLSNGHIIDYGPPADVITKESIRKVFDIEVDVVYDDGVPYVLPTGSTGFKMNEFRGDPSEHQYPEAGSCTNSATAVIAIGRSSRISAWAGTTGWATTRGSPAICRPRRGYRSDGSIRSTPSVTRRSSAP